MKKFLILGVVMVVGLAALSVGYAMWQKTLFISGTVETGNIGAEWSLVGGWDSEALLNPDKDSTSRAVCSLSADKQTAIMKVENGYPSIDYVCVFDVHGTGSVPVHLAKPSLDRGTLPPTSTLAVVEVPAEMNAPGLPACVVGTQLHESDRCLIAIGVHLYNDTVPGAGDGAAQDATYEFSGELMYHQWNETP